MYFTEWVLHKQMHGDQNFLCLQPLHLLLNIDQTLLWETPQEVAFQEVKRVIASEQYSLTTT